MSASIFPGFNAVPVCLKGWSEPTDKNPKFRLHCIVDYYVSDGVDFTHVPYDVAVTQGIAALDLVCDARYFNMIKHLLRERKEYLIDFIAVPWSMNGSKGISYQLRNLEVNTISASVLAS